jgi:hypothetical protein
VSSDNTGVFMGSFMYGIRQDTPEGWLRCDGNEYPANSYQNFIDRYITTEKIPCITLGQYEEELNKNNDNCGYFGYDETNNILRVPKLKDNIFIAQALNSGNIGKYNKEGLPNIMGKIIPYTGYGGTSEGAFFSTPYPDSRTASWGSGATNYTSFDASRSNVIYGSSEHVTPNHTQYPLFVCVSNQSQPITEDNVNLFIEGLNNKANIDGTNLNITSNDNLNKTTQETISTLPLPSSDYDDMTLLASASAYTMPANGYLFIRKRCNGAGQYIILENQTCGNMGYCIQGNSGFGINMTIPVKKNDVILINYTTGGATDYFRFIYAVGAKRN